MENLNRYLEDTKFVEWVFNPTEELNQYWDEYIEENPTERQDIQKLKEALSTFKSNDQVLSKNQKSDLLSDIKKSISTKSKEKKIQKLYVRTLKYASVVLLLVAVGILLYLQKEVDDQWAQMQHASEISPSCNTQLILPNGEHINLNEDNSKVMHTHSGEIVLNADTIILTKAKSNTIQLVVPFGKKSRITLPDGTTVFVNAGSRLAYPSFFEKNRREVKLVGEAYFEVKKDKKAPFVVKTSSLDVRVLGTKFNVSAYASAKVVETVLVEGSVVIHPNKINFFKKDILLKPNQKASYVIESGKSQVETVEVEDYTLWIEGVIRFRSRDLNLIVKELERFYNIEMEFEDSMLGMIAISGKLDLSAPMDAVFENLSLTASVTIEKQEDGKYIIK